MIVCFVPTPLFMLLDSFCCRCCKPFPHHPFLEPQNYSRLYSPDCYVIKIMHPFHQQICQLKRSSLRMLLHPCQWETCQSKFQSQLPATTSIALITIMKETSIIVCVSVWYFSFWFKLMSKPCWIPYKSLCSAWKMIHSCSTSKPYLVGAIFVSVFIYSMPGYACPIKERMLYSSSKNPVTDLLENGLHLVIAKKVVNVCICYAKYASYQHRNLTSLS